MSSSVSPASTQLYVDLDNARVEEQRQVMQDIIEAGHCPFCLNNLRKYHQQPILKEGKYWLVTKNQWPYENTKVHFLLIYKEHVEHISQLNPEAGAELVVLCKWISGEFSVPGGGVAIRFGDTNYSAGSVAHIHAQFIQPDISKPGYQPVRVKIGKSLR